MSSDKKDNDNKSKGSEKTGDGKINYLSPCESLSVDDRLFRTRFIADTEAHLVVDNTICKTCKDKPCTYVCPVQNYTVNEKEDVIVSWESCLECGACRVACIPKGLSWKYPNGGKGICLRQG